MVRAPRSKGCRVCVDRRVRCDQTRPHCTRCIKANRECPGYEVINIVDGMCSAWPLIVNSLYRKLTNIEKEGPSLKEMYHITDDDAEISQRESSSEKEARSTSPVRRRLRTPEPRDSKVSSPVISESNWFQGPFERYALAALTCPTAYQDQLLSNFIHSVRNPVVIPNFQWYGSWLGEVAQRSHPSVALIWSIRAISVAQLAKQVADDALIRTSRKLYGKALHTLNDALKDPAEGYSSDTLGATVLLSFFEIMNCTGMYQSGINVHPAQCNEAVSCGTSTLFDSS